jgi:protein-L-isoaspartate O-methyltransferase
MSTEQKIETAIQTAHQLGLDPVTPEFQPIGRATYSPEDNKIRIYPDARLPKDLYLRVKSAGFSWAPKQELFVAPKWTPEREDLAVELCGDLGDEDTTLCERAEQRAERFETYSEKRGADAERAHDSVSAITSGIPLGQPILIGHHSEKHARRDAERIESGMRKAVRMWETSKYWTSRAAGALAAAKYKEAPEVRARRIKGIGTDLRRSQKHLAEYVEKNVFWHRDDIAREMALAFTAQTGGHHLARKEGDRKDFNQTPSAHDALTGQFSNLYAPRTLQEVIDSGRRVYGPAIERVSRWIAHYENRIAYETAMLNEQGAGDLLKAAPRAKQLPLLNYPAKEISARRCGKMQVFPVEQMTAKEYRGIYEETRGTLEVEGTHRVRFACVSRDEFGQIERFPAFANRKWAAVFLTDSKQHEKPAAPAQKTNSDAPAMARPIAAPSRYVAPAPTKFDDMKKTLKAGVSVVVANQLFPTPDDVADRMVELADIRHGQSVLEPSAGTGRIVDAIRRAMVKETAGRCAIVAVEINQRLADRLRDVACLSAARVNCADFLTLTHEDLGTFERIIMNPPFERGADILHIQHALKFLRDNGMIVAICAAGPRQRELLLPLATSWEELPDGTFSDQGTNVRTVLATFTR